MPTYDYVCTACEHAFEEFQSMNDPLLRKCPRCGKLRLKRLIGSGAGIIFKGSGFYETDYKKKTGMSEGKASETKTPDPVPAKTDKAETSGTTAKTEKAESGSASTSTSKAEPKTDSGKASRSAAKPASKSSSRKSSGNRK
jgi:putative FmdB family regulatory protein